ncbi:2-amino-4-hydroxy-6-hydroxymethyldihydropteridine diphosphokinase [Lysobacter sp. SG-8]|uniref:2-amino-4-hydroxy-6-hydroxymethyldihydropteridine pyrophosphokinase n=1 Tax=Marilutibacter penaei TaxID=2759900 RepID=A0A7W3U1U3_9GAMM|nr:2-amino-4-hydroxy-6-hydroxymethyldihydropteridine diphosphokinase [Lysobacter penaei]MBB1087431.1 2-amino-4-hydroxy-6-hydroxymethyldihydropteridine diphosphokinase [Lysobacter penaei]
MTSTRACIGLGANLGDAAGAVRAAFDALAALPHTRLLAASPLYRTPAWGFEGQPDFINAVALVDTRLRPMDLLEALLRIEREAGRDRTADNPRWGPRRLDLDLLLYGDETIDVPGLQVPHPHLHARAFALVPLLDIVPGAVIPGHGPARRLLDAMAVGDIEALG